MRCDRFGFCGGTSGPFNLEVKHILISGGLAAGGVQTHTVALCRVLRAAPVEVTLIGARMNWDERTSACVKAMGVRIIVPRVGRIGQLRFLTDAGALLRRRFETVLCLGTSSLHRLACWVAKPSAFKIYNEIIPRPNQRMWPVIRRVDGLIGISKFNCRELSRLFPAQPVRRLPHLFNATRAEVPQERRPVLDSRPLEFAYLGRIDAAKRPERLVAEWRDITRDPVIGPARLAIYGDGDRRLVSRIEKIIREMDLTPAVSYRGPYDGSQLDSILDGVDVVLHPSEWEGLGLVPLEAMQRGVPVVATEACGTSELGEDNPDVVITRDNDWSAFRAGITSMGSRLRGGSFNSARLQRWVRRRYDLDTLSQRWLEALLQPKSFFQGTQEQ
jgi:glycosyltransferase involved in cell wall biosynthesis